MLKNFQVKTFKNPSHITFQFFVLDENLGNSFQLIAIYDIQTVVDEILEVCLFLKLDLNLQQT